MTQLEALKAIAKRNKGLLRPQAVVDAARSKSSPLHKAFCWDDTEAAKRYRLLQAQKLIRSFRVTVDDGDGNECEVPVFVNVSSDRMGGSDRNPYRLLEDLKGTDLMEVAERDALEQLRGMRDRYGHITKLKDVWDAIDSHG